MKIHDVEQRTPEWDALRAGRLTASMASKLVTPTGKASVQYKGEIARIIAERMGLQDPEFIKPTYWMERGIDMEEEARKWFELETNFDTVPVGFITDDSDYIGASPDALIGMKVPLELKVPKPSTHIRWLLERGVPKDHIAQVHFQMVLCESDVAWFASYCPDVRPLIVKVEWSKYTDLMKDKIEVYKAEFEDAWEEVCLS